jgi:predicted RNase H-like nuclease (RuvC/YqgF family)
MARQLEESMAATERTDELPVLSEEGIRKFERAGRTRGPDAGDVLDRSLEALRDALDTAERRWQRLETRLEQQDRAILELKAVLNQTAGVPELTEVVRPVVPVPTIAAAQAVPAVPPPVTPTPAFDQALLERIAGLEAYIAGRNDHWHDMEAELAAKAQRIAEIEQELEQRISREQDLARRLHDASSRSDELRDQLQRLRLRFETRQDADQ